MLDTGIDIPDVLNLVFFKIVKSRIKFWQMIGRGTRLSRDIFGISTQFDTSGHGDRDKKCFYIFDWCRNFEYFDACPNGQSVTESQSLTERLFCLRSGIAFHLQHLKYQEDTFCKWLHDELKAMLLQQVSSLSDHHISVRNRWKAVIHFKSPDSWTYISAVDVLTLNNEISPLLPKNTQDENAKKFDVLALTIQLSMLDEKVDGSGCIRKVRLIAEKLQEKASIPQIGSRMGTLKEVMSDAAWENATLEWVEKVRNEMRDLMKFLVGDDGQQFVVDIRDVISGVELNARQEEFLSTIISYICENGDITKETLVSEAPFDERLSIFEAFYPQLRKYVENIHDIVSYPNISTRLYTAN